MLAATHFNRRTHERFSLNPMYTSIHVMERASVGESRCGHIYDISETGARIELDEEMPAGCYVTVRMELPGAGEAIALSGSVVRVNDHEDDPGPRRLALRFNEYATSADHERLVRYLGSGQLRRAA